MITYMKRLMIFTGIFSLAFVAACGGGGNDKVPPPQPVTMQNPTDQQVLSDLFAQAMRAKQTCTQDYTPMFLVLATSMAQPGANAAGANPMAALMPQLMAQPSGSGCQNDMMNLLMAFTTVMVPPAVPGGAAVPYANLPESRQWMALQLAGIANGIWNNIKADFAAKGVQLPAEMQASIQTQLLQAGMTVVQGKIIPGLGPLSGPAQQGFAQYAGGV